jgi:ribosome maturation factor RimP
MITTEQVKALIEDKLKADGAFLVDLTISTGNKIAVTIDSEKGIPISYCIDISRQIEHNLDREQEDFSLDVSSAGLDQPLKLPRQFKKNMGREVAVTLPDKKLTGILTNANDTAFSVEIQEKVKLEGQRKKEVVTTSHEFQYDEVKDVKVIVSFK